MEGHKDVCVNNYIYLRYQGRKSILFFDSFNTETSTSWGGCSQENNFFSFLYGRSSSGLISMDKSVRGWEVGAKMLKLELISSRKPGVLLLLSNNFKIDNEFKMDGNVD